MLYLINLLRLAIQCQHGFRTPQELCGNIFFSRKMSFRLLQSIDEIILTDLEYRSPRQSFLHIFNVAYYVEHSKNCHNQKLNLTQRDVNFVIL